MGEQYPNLILGQKTNATWQVMPILLAKCSYTHNWHFGPRDGPVFEDTFA